MPIDPVRFVAFSRDRQRHEVHRLTRSLLEMPSRDLLRLYQKRTGQRPYWAHLRRPLSRSEAVYGLLRHGLFEDGAVRPGVRSPGEQFMRGFDRICYGVGVGINDPVPTDLEWADSLGEASGRLCRADFVRRKYAKRDELVERGQILPMSLLRLRGSSAGYRKENG